MIFIKLWRHKATKTFDFSISNMTSDYDGGGEPCLPAKYPENYELMSICENTIDGLRLFRTALIRFNVAEQYAMWIKHHASAANTRRLS